MTEQVSIRRIKDYIKKLKIEDNTILLIRDDCSAADVEMWRTALAGMKLNNMLIVIVKDLEDVELWDKAVMQKHGWYRLEDLQKLFVKAQKDG